MDYFYGKKRKETLSARIHSVWFYRKRKIYFSERVYNIACVLPHKQTNFFLGLGYDCKFSFCSAKLCHVFSSLYLSYRNKLIIICELICEIIINLLLLFDNFLFVLEPIRIQFGWGKLSPWSYSNPFETNILYISVIYYYILVIYQ